MPQIRDWGTNASVLRKVIRWMRDLPIHFIAICLEIAEKDERTGVRTFCPSLPGKLAAELPGYFDVVGRLIVNTDKEGEIERELLTAPGPNHMAKDRTDQLGKSQKKPTFETLYKLLMEA